MALPTLAWVHIEASAVKHDSHSEVLPVSVSMSMVSSLLDRGIVAFSQHISATIAQVAENRIKVSSSSWQP